MVNFYDEFISYLEDENKEKAVEIILKELESKEIQIVELYNNVLAPALNNMECRLKDKRVCIWKEHVRSSIIRTIIECCYPYVIREKTKDEKNKNVVVICPSEEYHEIGARMAADFFTLCGYNTTFVGGYAFKNNKEAVKNVGADIFIDSFEDVKNLSKEGN